MVYECENCSATLPYGVTVCPKCGEKFDQAVPTDAEMTHKGFKAVESDAPVSATSIKPYMPTTDEIVAKARQEAERVNQNHAHSRPAPAPNSWNANTYACVVIGFILVMGFAYFMAQGAQDPAAPQSNASISAPVTTTLQDKYDNVQVGWAESQVQDLAGRPPDLTYTGASGQTVLQWKDNDVNVWRVMVKDGAVVGSTYVPVPGGPTPGGVENTQTKGDTE